MIENIIVLSLVIIAGYYAIKSLCFGMKEQKCSNCEVKCNNCTPTNEHPIVWKNRK